MLSGLNASEVLDILDAILMPGSVQVNTDPNKTCVKVSGEGIHDDTFAWSTSPAVRKWFEANGVDHVAIFIQPYMIYAFPANQKAQAVLFKLAYGGS